MDRENGVASVDAAEVGLAVAFPGGLRSYIEGLAGEAAPVEKAVAAAWAGMDSLRVVTAELNGSVVRPRVIGLSRARQALVDGASAPDWRGSAELRGSVRAEGDDRASSPVSEAGEAGEAAVGRAAGGLGTVGDLGTAGDLGSNGSVAPVVVRVGEDGRAADFGGLASSEGGDDGAAAPSIEHYGGTAEPFDDVEGPQRSIAPVKVRIERGVASEGRLAGGWSAALPGGEMDVTSAAAAPVVGHGKTPVAGLRADVASALRSHERARMAVDDDAAASGAPGRQEQHSAVTRRTEAGFQGAGEAGGEALSGEVMAPHPPGRDGGAGGGDLVLGNIMLDGHPVGTWMGSRIARDAARPGAGTTAFDPRQAPAWTPSGAL